MVNQQMEAASKELCKNQEALVRVSKNRSKSPAKQKHSKFTRRGKDLHITLDITLRETSLGVRKEISYLDTRTAIVKRKGVSRPYGNRRRGYKWCTTSLPISAACKSPLHTNCKLHFTHHSYAPGLSSLNSSAEELLGRAV